ncbi:2-dehydro-3-deoxyphosphogluconate aldolase/4-hydroxy-2-oxoglutarate aldolase [Haloferax prahovense DSM 18310]|uniref:2-dehydro-3-deoxyphosphogluconate aldolase/4-hydroxy-2-oxoglutarate aldolase n=1 Tax=Haloferax prahovense (strain DSM 18310 / JCM 13924 / TL6) TaxID=1227461 RepID=M0FX44_HALPT|nr:2-dehydro-3-deoxyphosphogluconate aldolase/4-hydroxy-2-oxoglutarate aldolase [Haloferax prahovense DSM 18310]
MVKVFPTGTLGPGFVSALGGPLGHIPTVPTGGVGLDNVGEFGVIEANARAFSAAVEAARTK